MPMLSPLPLSLLDRQLYGCAAAGDVHTLRSCLDQVANPTLFHGEFTPLMVAARDGHLECVRLLLQVAPDTLNLLGTEERNSALMLALQHERFDVVEFLLTQPAVLGGPNRWGETPLIQAVAHDRHDLLAPLLAISPEGITHANLVGNTAVHLAAGDGHLKSLSVLLRLGGEACLPLANGDNGCLPLHEAAKGGSLACVQLLLQAQAAQALPPTHSPAPSGDPSNPLIHLNSCDHRGNTPLLLAIENQHLDLAAFLLQQPGVSLQANEEGVSPLMMASQRKLPNLFPPLLAQGNSLFATDAFGQTALMRAAASGDAPTLLSLLSLGATRSLRTRTERQRFALEIAVENDAVDCVRILLQHYEAAEAAALLSLPAPEIPPLLPNEGGSKELEHADQLRTFELSVNLAHWGCADLLALHLPPPTGHGNDCPGGGGTLSTMGCRTRTLADGTRNPLRTEPLRGPWLATQTPSLMVEAFECRCMTMRTLSKRVRFGRRSTPCRQRFESSRPRGTHALDVGGPSIFL